MGEPNPMVQIEDFLAVIQDLCPDCCQRVKRALIHRLAIKAMPVPLPKKYVAKELAELLEAIAGDHDLTVEVIVGHSNEAPLVKARREFAKQARARGYSFPVIGRAMGRHHTTVINLLNGAGWDTRKVRVV